MKIAILWESKDCGLYSNSPFDLLYRKIGHNNGNLAFVYAAVHQIDADLHYYPWHFKPEVVNANVDMVVIPCANQLGGHTDLGKLAEKISALTVPVIAIGLGAQAKAFDADVELKPGTLAWLQALIDNGKRFGVQNIYTRGPYTSEQILKLTGAETVPNGCPTHFINPNPNLGKAIQANWEKSKLPRRIAVAAGHEAWSNTREIEQQLIGLMMDPQFPGIYVTQSMMNMIKTSRGLFDDLDPADLAKVHHHTVPHYTLEEFKDWCLNYARSYYDVPAWMDDLRRHDLLIGPRFHGAQLAIQAERMACTVTIDTRTEEMCRETGIPYIPAAELKTPITRTSLKAMIKFDGAAYDALRAAKCKRYVDFLEGAGLKPMAYLKEIAAA